VADLKGKVMRVESWEKFKQLLTEHKPRNIIYNLEKGIPAGSLKGLRLILPSGEAQHIFIDTAVGNNLRKTAIPLHRDRSGNQHIAEEDITFHSYWIT